MGEVSRDPKELQSTGLSHCPIYDGKKPGVR